MLLWEIWTMHDLRLKHIWHWWDIFSSTAVRFGIQYILVSELKRSTKELSGRYTKPLGDILICFHMTTNILYCLTVVFMYDRFFIFRKILSHSTFSYDTVSLGAFNFIVLLRPSIVRFKIPPRNTSRFLILIFSLWTNKSWFILFYVPLNWVIKNKISLD